MSKPYRGVRVGAGRETNLRRRASLREPRQAVLIVTNGRATEPVYFAGIKSLPWAQGIRAVVVFRNGAPIEVVRDAGRRRDDNDFDQAWAVCDVDEFETVKATAAARRLDVGLAWSNPSFEVWLILHLAAHRAHLQNAEKAVEKLGRLLRRDFDKVALDFSDFEAGVADAVRRAKLLGEPPTANPSTNVWAVLEALGFPE